MHILDHGLIAAALLGLLCGCTTGGTVLTDPSAATGDLVLRAAGSGSWDIHCEATTQRGTSGYDIKGRGNAETDVMAVRDVMTAACSYETGAYAVSLTLSEEGLSCPFGEFEGGVCRTFLAAESSGEFKLSAE